VDDFASVVAYLSDLIKRDAETIAAKLGKVLES
jgi:hypothetical protein